ncbi:GNAT family N-acetyltransferase [Pseudonocardia lutea]|uniref:GNAT family N-acetyltransferase n=1 Tax=Pseudonocardia lutea TaxID=2172015 RepID=A0ABW1I8D0_9PSEU
MTLELRATPFDHPDAQRLKAAVQQVYVERYGGEDETRTDPAEFAAPHGLFLVGYAAGTAVAAGGWRVRDAEPADPVVRNGDAEIKRMYVVPEARGRGHARAVLAAIERSAAAAGRRRMILETGTKQPEAVALYRSAGYVPIPGFGVYRDEPGSLCFAKIIA